MTAAAASQRSGKWTILHSAVTLTAVTLTAVTLLTLLTVTLLLLLVLVQQQPVVLLMLHT